VLRGIGEAQDPQHAVSNTDHENQRAGGAVGPATLIDCDNAHAPTPRATQGGDTPGETDGRSSVCLSGNSSLPLEQGQEQGSPNIPATSVPSSEARYDFHNLRSLISLLTEARNLEIPPFAKRQIIPSPVPRLLLFHHYQQPLISSSRPYPIHRKDRGTGPSTISDLVPSMKEKRRQAQVMGTMQIGTMPMGIHELGTGRLQAL